MASSPITIAAMPSALSRVFRMSRRRRIDRERVRFSTRCTSLDPSDPAANEYPTAYLGGFLAVLGVW
ncbi:hypothetical protein Agsp01_02870 [Agromyces sp. NBRC 114283]|nr:hypothetical protein Agsp01_02870 [Agromyces sp. NBRC 114283]